TTEAAFKPCTATSRRPRSTTATRSAPARRSAAWARPGCRPGRTCTSRSAATAGRWPRSHFCRPSTDEEFDDMVNKVILVGRLTADPDIRALPSGTFLANMRMATNTYGGKEEDGTKKEYAEFHSLVAFGR